MKQDDIRKRIIKDKFNKLTPYIIGLTRQIILISDKKETVGVKVYNTNIPDPSFFINADYFMFKFIGIDNEEEKNKYGNYILKLVMDEFPFAKFTLDANDVHHYIPDSIDSDYYDDTLMDIKRLGNMEQDGDVWY